MKYRNIILLLVVAVLFLTFASHTAVRANSGKTVQLTIYNLSGGG
jgi:ABC-type proline/glycine betaine transport system substrate-binding protein